MIHVEHHVQKCVEPYVQYCVNHHVQKCVEPYVQKCVNHHVQKCVRVTQRVGTIVKR